MRISTAGLKVCCVEFLKSRKWSNHVALTCDRCGTRIELVDGRWRCKAKR